MPSGASTEGVAALVILKPPMFDANRFEQRLDGELVVRLASYRLTDQGGMSQSVRGIAAGGARIESKLRGSLVAAVAQDVFPRAVVGRARGFGADAGGVIEQLFHCDLLLARIAERLR